MTYLSIVGSKVISTLVETVRECLEQGFGAGPVPFRHQTTS